MKCEVKCREDNECKWRHDEKLKADKVTDALNTHTRGYRQDSSGDGAGDGHVTGSGYMLAPKTTARSFGHQYYQPKSEPKAKAKT